MKIHYLYGHPQGLTYCQAKDNGSNTTTNKEAVDCKRCQQGVN